MAASSLAGPHLSRSISKASPLPSANVPPPAYSPQEPFDLAAMMATRTQHLQHQHTQQARTRIPQPRDASWYAVSRTPLAHMLASARTGQDTQDDQASPEVEAAGLSAISLRINTSITISKSDNLVCLTETPAAHANAIAQAVVGAIQDNSSGNCGIPMVDEEGRPRPLNIEVDASMVVEGSGNVVGHEVVIQEAIRHRSLLRRRRHEEEELPGTRKRPRSTP